MSGHWCAGPLEYDFDVSTREQVYSCPHGWQERYSGDPDRPRVTRVTTEVAYLRGEVQHIAEGLGKSAEKRNDLRAERDELAARLAAVEALADEWEAYARGVLIDLGGGATWHARHAKALRAALAAPTDTTKETDR